MTAAAVDVTGKKYYQQSDEASTLDDLQDPQRDLGRRTWTVEESESDFLSDEENETIVFPQIQLRPPDERERFGPVSCQDGMWLIIFFAFSSGFFVFEVIELRLHKSAQEPYEIVMMSVIVSAVIGMICLSAWIWLTRVLIWFSQLLSVGCVLFLGLLFFSFKHGNLSGALFAFCTALVMVYWLFNNRHKTDFAAIMLETVSKLLIANPSVIVIAFVILFIQAVWLGLFGLTCVEVLNLSFYPIHFIYLFFAFLWTTQVLKFTIHTTVAGTIAQWYFGSNTANSLSPIDCFRRTRYFLGSIALGSLLVAPIRTTWAGSYSFAGLCRCCNNILVGVQGLFYGSNKYAFTHVIIYGKSFRKASQEAWEQFLSRGVDAILREDKVDAFLVYPAIGGGSALASFVALWASYIELKNWFIICVVVFWIAYAMISFTTELVEAAATALVTCFAIDSRPLSETYPVMFQRFMRIAHSSHDVFPSGGQGGGSSAYLNNIGINGHQTLQSIEFDHFSTPQSNSPDSGEHL